jgi:hypothetical protein
MRDKIRFYGGVRAGWMNATWPLAQLTCSRDRITLDSLIGGWGFRQDQVVAIEEYIVFPVIDWGVRIHHNISEYPEKHIFWWWRNPRRLIARIEAIGFVSQAEEFGRQPTA